MQRCLMLGWMSKADISSFILVHSGVNGFLRVVVHAAGMNTDKPL